MSAEVLGWHDEHLLDHRRRLRNATCVSLALHGLVFAAFAVAPPRPKVELPQVIAVDLIASPLRAPAAKPGPAAKAKPAPEAPAAPPAPAPEPPPVVTKAPVQVLPEETPGRIREAKPEPKVVAKAKPEPKPTPRRRRKREKSLSYEDAMAALDEELGVDETAELLAPAPSREESAETGDSSGAPDARPGAVVSPELARWNLATQRRIQSKWVTPPSFRGRGLATTLELRLSASGDLIGEPRVVGSSGDPYFDDNAVRAVLQVAPLPPPPEAGRRAFIFRSEAN